MEKFNTFEMIGFIYLIIDFILGVLIIRILPISGKIISELIILLSLNSLSEKMKMRRNFGFTGWFYITNPSMGLISLDASILLSYHSDEIANYINKKRHEKPYSGVTLDVNKLDFLSKECKQELSLLYYATDGFHGYDLISKEELLNAKNNPLIW